MQSLRSDGYHIEAVRNKGYCLSGETDILSVQGMQKYLQPACANVELSVFPPADGFPDEIKDIAGAVFREAQNDGKTNWWQSF